MSLASTKLTSSRQNSCWQLHHVKGMRFARHTGSWCGLFEEWMGLQSAFASRLHKQNRCLGQARRQKQRGAEEIHLGALSSCKRKREGFNLTELIGLPVTVASLAYWQTYTLQTLVCIFHCFACQCKPGKVACVRGTWFMIFSIQIARWPQSSFHLTLELSSWASHLCLLCPEVSERRENHQEKHLCNA